MKVLRSESGDAIGVELNTISFRSFLRALRSIPGLVVERAKQNPMNDEAFAAFTYKEIRFEIHTPISDYWIDKPQNCPQALFDEIFQSLERFRVRWWHRIP
jgi:hypothetical protein